MPQNQDPYGSHAYRQRIFKEMQSAINFRQVQRCGGFIGAPYATTGDPYFLREALPSTQMNRFTLRAPYSYVNKDTPSKSSLPSIVAAPTTVAVQQPLPTLTVVPVALEPRAVAEKPQQQQAAAPVRDAEVVKSVRVAAPVADDDDRSSQWTTKPQLGRPIISKTERAKSATVLRQAVQQQRTAEPMAPASITKAPQATRCLSAAVQRPAQTMPSSAVITQPPLMPSNNSSGKPPPSVPLLQKMPMVRAASASVRSSGGVSVSSSTDSVVAGKVAMLERTLQEERETRMRLCNQLAQLESMLSSASPKKNSYV